MSNDILKVIYDDYTDMSFASEGVCPFSSEEWREENAAMEEFAQRLSLSDNDRSSLECDVISGFSYKSGLEGFINGFKLAVRLFGGK